MSEIKVNSIKGVGASTAAITVNNSDGTCTANITNNLSNRNVIVNGKCQIAQRGTSSTSSGYGSVDRFKMSVTNTDELAFAQKQTSDGPDGFKKCFEFDVTTAESTLAADELVYLRYGVEAQDLTPFYNADGSGKDFVLSFYVKAYQAGTYQMSIYKSDSPRFITKTYTISSSGVWQRIELAFTGDTGAYAVDDNNEVGFWLDFKLAAGTDYTSGGQVTTWGSFGNSVFAGGHAVNVLSSTDNYWRITGLQLELDSGSGKATDFEHRSFGQELALCQRYFYRLAGDDTTITTGHQNGSYGIFPIQYPQEMRAQPTSTAQTVTDAYSYYYEGSVARINTISLQAQNNRHGNLESTSYNTSDGTVGFLRITNSSAYIDISAEL